MSEVDESTTTAFEVVNPDIDPNELSTEDSEESVSSKESDEQEEAGSEANAAKENQAEVESFTPDFTYSVMDQKKEFPEWVREAIKDKKIEDELRDILTRADGLAPVKEKLGGLTEKYGKLETDHNGVIDRMTELQYYLDKGHYSHFFKEVGIPEQKIVDFVADLIRQQDMTPEQRAQVQAYREQDIASYQQIKNSNLLQQQNRQLMINQHQIQMDQAMMMPQAKKVADYVDSIQGSGSFKEAVNTYGRAFFHQNGYDLNPAEAVAVVMKQYQAFVPNNDASLAGNDLAQAKAELQAGKPTGHIPNIGKKTGTAPVKRAPKSLDDLKKLANQFS